MTKKVKMREDNWVKRSEEPVHNPRRTGLLWDLACVWCNAQKFLTTSQVNANNPKCSCMAKLNATRLFKYEGVIQSIQQWKKVYPLVESSVRDRSSNRELGVAPYCNYTDAQVLFGKAGKPENHTEFTVLEDQAKASQVVLNDLNSHATYRMGKLHQEILLEALQALQIHVLKRPDDDKAFLDIAGADLEVSGSTLREYLEMGMEVEEILELICMEEYESIEQKCSALNPFIVPDDRLKEVTKTELMALFSTLTLFDL